jgi:ADP-dependent NAD(P)H-hydrate dehydratase / NAD(P)H-hydrate epimerase
MELILSVEQMKNMDRQAIEDLGIPSICLMENAGQGTSETILGLISESASSKITIICGGGNNGGDGYVVARCLVNAGFYPEVFALSPLDKLEGDTRINRQILHNMAYPVIDIEDQAGIPDFREYDLAIDAMLGTGFSGKPRGLYATAISLLQDSGIRVISIDVPSGVNADDGSVSGAAVFADSTATMCAPKRGLLLSPGREFCGELEIVDIGYNPGLFCDDSEWMSYHTEEIAAILPPRIETSHKGSYGKVLVLAGSPGMPGAAMLASRAVLRAGAGMVKLAIDAELANILAPTMPEVMTLPIDRSRQLEQLLEACKWADVLAIGPGLGKDEATIKLVQDLVIQAPIPVILDADGINAFAGKTELLANRKADLCITPHPGEFENLVGKTFETVLQRIEAAQLLAQDLEIDILLKGAPSAILSAAGETILGSTVCSALSTAGSGDVLTGMVAGLVAQGSTLNNAAIAGCELHVICGELAAASIGERSVIAPDLLNFISAAFKFVDDDTSGQTHKENGSSCSHDGSCQC